MLCGYPLWCVRTAGSSSDWKEQRTHMAQGLIFKTGTRIGIFFPWKNYTQNWNWQLPLGFSNG